ncbi:hypothetical protein CAT7_00125 [Carnobacterium sp. AT7]|uniref:DUF1189 domain-containing protein n=1 Tax=Carnobacterium TaxID=2747 RepID=UPI00015EF6F6|nr:DUF1189 domain-containing protein [Carnobacterium sp. AT7]EDP67817.1 hypothetical protein CAT7_00125 [Carnobacterium sp. AT7]
MLIVHFKKYFCFIKSGEITIQLINLVKDSLLHPEKLVQAIHLKKGKTVLYFLFIAFIATIPLWIQSSNTIDDFGHDGQIISESIPSFKIENDQLVTNEPVKSYIYQTDSIIFTFDPNGERTIEDVEQDLIGNQVGIAFLENGLYFSIPSYPIHFPYTQLNGLTSDSFIDLILSVQSFGGTLQILTFIMVFLISLLLTFIYTLLSTLFANVLSIITGKQLKIGENFKIVLVASTLPTLFIAFLNSVGLVPAFQIEIKTMVTLFIYYLAIRAIPKGKK